MKRRVLILLGLLAAFLAFYLLMAPSSGGSAGSPAGLVVLAVGYLLGPAAGLVVGLLMMPLLWSTYPLVGLSLDETGLPSMMAFVALMAALGGGGGFIGLMQTRSEQAHKQAARLNLELQHAQESAGLGYWSLHRGGRIEWSQELVRVFGFEESPPDMETIYARLHPDDRTQAEANIAELWNGSGPFEGEQRAVWPDGSVHWIHYTSTVEKNDEGEVERILGTTLDITEIKRAEETDRRFLELIDRLDDVYFTDDLRGNLRVSAAVQEVYGRSPQEFHDDPELWQNALVDEDRPIAERAFQRIKQGRQTEYTIRIQHTDGSVRTLRATVWPHIDADQVVGAVGVVHDITAREELVRLKELDEMKAVFMSAAAHELNTPLTPLKLQVAILENTLPDNDGVQIVKRNVHRMEALVHDLLDASRLQAGRLKYDLQDDMDLTAILDDVMEGAALQAQEEDKQWRADIPTDLHMRGDPGRLTQVFQNLTSNAIKFTPEGGRITVTAREEQDHIRIQVQDTGLGLEPDEIQGLFQPFQQFHHGEMGVHRGTGLGLFISQGIVENHQGRIEVESEGEGKGATFTVVLPKDSPPEATATPGGGGYDEEE